jgi:ABC-type multidrug transport system fused ATPase/permease subunit
MPDSNQDVYGNLANQFPNIASLTSNTLVSNNANLSVLNASTNNLQQNLSQIQGQSNDTLSKQQEMNSIVQAEQARLNDKKGSIDNAYSSQQRAIYMNDNVSKRYNAYSRILFIVVIILFIIFALVMLQPYLPFIPSMIFNVVFIGLVSFMIIYCLGIYFDIERHEKIDYDRIYNKPLTAPLDSSYSDISYNFDSSYGFCANNSCCATGTYWDTTIHQCSPGNPPGYKEKFTTIAENSPYEYSEYSKY